jgi:predicted O-linked N-acetylglucosamine transferase (SPINDLY family)
MTVHPANIVDGQALISSLFERARNRDLSLPDLIGVAETLMGAGQPQLGAELYKTWLAFNADHPLAHMASFNFSVALRATGDVAGSIHALLACARMDPEFGPGRINLGRAFEDCGKIDAALNEWKAFVVDGAPEINAERAGHKLMALQHIGRVCENVERLAEAEQWLWQAIELRPDKTETGQHWIAVRQRLCLWPTLKASSHVSRRQLMNAMSPISLACFADDPMFQLAKAWRYCQTFVGRPDVAHFVRNPVALKTGTGARLRVGYVSSDLRDHAVGFALSEVVEHRDPGIEIFAYSLDDARPGDATQQRLRRAFDHWRELSGLADRDAATRIVEDRIDILIDVNGYTKHARTGIFAYRPAPVIVNFCGYPGTMGSPWHQYMIADPVIVPPDSERYFSEKVLHIGCNQPVDRKRVIDPRTPTRAEAGLPEGAFVYASLNGMQKITASCFARWMTILSEVQDSVLWLLSGDEDAHARLRAAAAERGVAPERLIFAAKAANPQHLARIALADLFLDTTPYGAHSSAADALTMGLPVLTVPGRSFAARFCASVVTAAGLPDLVCATQEDYVRRAVAFGRDRAALADAKSRLRDARETCALRDIPALARRLEALFWQMQAEAERGETPVPDLRNLDIYYEIGAELDADMEALDEGAFRALYRDKLEAWNALAPIRPDARFWSDKA